MKTIKAETYNVHFQHKAYKELSNFVEDNNYSTVFILVDENTKKYCLPVIYPFFDFENMKIHKEKFKYKKREGFSFKNMDIPFNRPNI